MGAVDGSKEQKIDVDAALCGCPACNHAGAHLHQITYTNL